jgi:hypothetical protein
MNRDLKKDSDYWNNRADIGEKALIYQVNSLKKPPADPSYEPFYAFELAREYWHMIFYRYSRGDPIAELSQYFPHMLEYWELSNRLLIERNEERAYPWHADYVNWYMIAFWLVGLALVFGVPDDQWQRLLALIGNEGEDLLLDRIIATREPGRRIGTQLCHPRPYRRLLAAIDAPPQQQARRLATFVNNWYRELARRTQECAPYWYNYYNVEGAYFGYWCVEAVAAVKAFGLDDHLCLGHPHYPGDLLRPEGPTTHLPCSERVLSEALGKPKVELKKEQQGSWVSRWYHGLRAEVLEALGQGQQVRKGKK